MINPYVEHGLVRFVYREMSAEEMAEVKQLLARDSAFRREYHELQQAKQMLPKVQFLPAPDVVRRILQYSTKTALRVSV